MKARQKPNRRPLRAILLCVLCLAALLVLNRCIYTNILPIIFFHAGFSEDAYEANRADETLSALAIPSESGTLYGWEWGEPSDVVVLYFGGDASDSNAWIASVSASDRETAFGGTKLLTVDYPSFGRSEGVINEQTFYAAAEALYAYAESAYPEAKKVAVGYSLGCSAVLKVASEHALDGAILVAPMYDGTTMYFPRTSILHAYFEPTASVKLDNDLLAALVTERVLIVASTGDSMTKLSDIEAMCGQFPAPPERVVLDGVGHGEYWETAETFAAIGRFLAEERGAA